MAAEDQNITATLNKIKNDYNLLQIRLDTSQIIEQAKMFLNAEIEIIKQDNETGQFIREVISVGTPKANKRGVAAILNWLQMIINSQVVQGNFPVDKYGLSEMYEKYIYECQVDLMDVLMTNLYVYDIEEDELQSIVDSIMNLIKPFMTRLIGNKERESYGETFKEISSNITRDHSKLPVFKG